MKVQNRWGSVAGSKQSRLVLPKSEEKNDPPPWSALRIEGKTPLVFPSNCMTNWTEYQVIYQPGYRLSTEATQYCLGEGIAKWRRIMEGKGEAI